MGTPRRIESSERLCWPQHKFELTRGESVIADFDALPTDVRRKLRYLIERGVVRVLEDDGEEQQANDIRTEDRLDASAEPVADGPLALNTSRSVRGSSVGDRTGSEARAEEPIDVKRVFALAEDIATFGATLANPIRAAIVIVLARGATFAPSELARLLRKPRQTVSRHALSLERAGVLTSERKHGACHYRLTARSAERVTQLLGAVVSTDRSTAAVGQACDMRASELVLK